MIIFNPNFQHQKGWIGDDGVHLHKNHAVKYWEDNFKDIQYQIESNH